MKPFYNFDIEQRSPEWHEAKLGKFSGSDSHRKKLTPEQLADCTNTLYRYCAGRIKCRE